MRCIVTLAGFLLVLVTLPGCIIGEPRQHRDFLSAQREQELFIQQNMAPLGSDERQLIDNELNDLNYKWHLDLTPPVEQTPPAVDDDRERIRAINERIDRSLREGGNNK